MKRNKVVINRGRQSSGFGQRQILSEEYAVACNLYGKTFIDSHLEAMKDGHTKRTLGDLIKQKLKK